MREILFRAKLAHNKEWAYSCSLISFAKPGDEVYFTQFETPVKTGVSSRDNITSITGEDAFDEIFFKVIPDTICAYTGLNDKNGNKIFEGDILKCDGVFDERNGFAVVRWCDDTCSFALWTFENGEPTRYALMNTPGKSVNDNLEIVGNTIDNPRYIYGAL